MLGTTRTTQGREMDDVDADRGLGLLVRGRGRDLTAYAFMLTGEHAAAQDLVQDAIVKVFARTRKGFVPDVAEAYVRRTMLTLYVDGYRRKVTWCAPARGRRQAGEQQPRGGHG